MINQLGHAIHKQDVHEHANISTHSLPATRVTFRQIKSPPPISFSLCLPRGTPALCHRGEAPQLKQPSNPFGWCSTSLQRARYSNICIFISRHNVFLTTLRCYSALWWWSTRKFMVNSFICKWRRESQTGLIKMFVRVVAGRQSAGLLFLL